MAEYSWVKALALGCAFLTFNAGVAAYRSNGDAGSILCIAVFHLDLMALLWMLLDDRLRRHSAHLGKIKAAILSLATLLIVLFGYTVTKFTPLAFKLFYWAMAAATTCGGVYAFFVYDHKGYRQRQQQEEEDVEAAAVRGEGAKY